MVWGFGIDIGGTSVKAAAVDTATGELRSPVRSVDTPQPATPEAIAMLAADLYTEALLAGLDPEVPVGAVIPAIVKRGRALSAANIDGTWIGADVASVFSKHCGRHVQVANDADAAGLAEVQLGAAADQAGVVCVLTLGTGIGSALFIDGTLVPNTEFGHLHLDGHTAEHWAAPSARHRESLSLHEWATRLRRYLEHLDRLVSPDLIVLGGGISERAEEFLPWLGHNPRVVAAQFHAHAGIVGAALLSRRTHSAASD